MKAIFQQYACVNIFRSVKAFVFLFLLLGTGSFSVSAQNFTVTSGGDSHAVTPTASALDAGNQITLRSAMEASTAIAGSHIITIPSSITTITLNINQQMTVGNAAAGNNITINGPGKSVLTINQSVLVRTFFTGSGAITFNVNDLTLNYTGPGASAVNGAISGGGGAILSGGINANTTLTNVAVNNFNIQLGNGGAVSCSTGNTNNFTLTNCDFNNNYCGGGGGAVSVNTNSTAVITNCRFTNNSTGNIFGLAGANNTGGSGGALSTTGSGNGGTYTVTNCTFTNNHQTTASQGGAIMNTNGTLNVSFCRFVGNSANIQTNGNVIAQAGGGSVQAVVCNNNWWGINDGPVTNDLVVLAAGGTITCTKWLQLKTSSSVSPLCTNSQSTITTSFLSNSAAEAVTAANVSTLIGLPVSFSATSGTISGAQATIQASGTATALYTSGNSAGTGTVNAVVDNVPTTDIPARASVTITAQTLATTNTVTQTVGTSNNTYHVTGSCAAICKVVPDGGANQITGSVTARIWVESSLPHISGQPYVRRHYQITPGTNPSAATAIITLYFSQAEFTEFNADPNSTLNLPANAGDAAGIANMRIAKYAGSSGNGTGLPDSYTGASSIIIPSATFNSTLGRWEVSFNVAGFSGFILQTNTSIVPVKLISFEGVSKNKSTTLVWRTANADATISYELQRSFNGNDFKTIYTKQGDAYTTLFSYDDPVPAADIFYYRLGMRDADGSISYSHTVTIRNGVKQPEISIYPNPAKRGEQLKITLTDLSAGKLQIVSAAGKIIFSAESLIAGSFAVILPSDTAPGIYFVKIFSGNGVVVKKIFIE